MQLFISKGEFFSEKTRADPPFEAQPFTMPEQQAFMLSVGLSEFTLNSASYVYYSYGVFQRFIDDSMVSRPGRRKAEKTGQDNFS